MKGKFSLATLAKTACPARNILELLCISRWPKCFKSFDLPTEKNPIKSICSRWAEVRLSYREMEDKLSPQSFYIEGER